MLYIFNVSCLYERITINTIIDWRYPFHADWRSLHRGLSDKDIYKNTFAFFFLPEQIRDRQRHPGPGERLRATGPGPQPVGPERAGRILVHRPGRHAHQRQVRGRTPGLRAGRRPSAHPTATPARNRQVARVPRHPTVHTGTGLQQEEVNDTPCPVHPTPHPQSHSLERPLPGYLSPHNIYRFRLKFYIC